MRQHNLARYHARSPRYILLPQDNNIIRLAGPMQIPWEEGTDIKNISLTGLAFTVPSDLCPSIGEFIKIEYQVPGSQKMACHALVTRLEDLSTSRILVGVKFFRIELAQRVLLAQSLSFKLKEQQLRQLQERKRRMGASRFLPFLFLILWSFVYYIMTMWTWLVYLSEQ